jgi:peptidoglycan hydrolase-like protein with peptidoglycan-binding domain
MSLIFTAGLVTGTLVPALGAQATSAVRITATLNTSMTVKMPVLRLRFSAPVSAAHLPQLVTRPALTTTWQQIGPREVQAMATGALLPSTQYVIQAPRTMSCGSRCKFTLVRSLATSVASDVAWEDQYLAELKYLPLRFTPLTSQSDPSQPTVGTYSWAYQNLPSRLSSLWHYGASNIILTGALMAFQKDHQLLTTGIADATTWSALISAVQQHQVDPNPYSYVDVNEATPQTLTLYVAGRATFHTLVNSGISVAPTALGTYPVYLRYTSQTMSGTNPDGSHYSDPGIPWVSYFNGGDALHGFIRSTYGWPQSLGCVEMPFAAAKTIWPDTSIGTLVTVR